MSVKYFSIFLPLSAQKEVYNDDQFLDIEHEEHNNMKYSHTVESDVL